MKEPMGFDGLNLSLDEHERMFMIEKRITIACDMCYGYMTYQDAHGDTFIVPAEETNEGVRAKIKEFEETGVDPFARDYEKAPPFDPNRIY